MKLKIDHNTIGKKSACGSAEKDGFVKLSLSSEQVEMLSQACEIVSRLYAGQTDILGQVRIPMNSATHSDLIRPPVPI